MRQGANRPPIFSSSAGTPLEKMGPPTAEIDNVLLKIIKSLLFCSFRLRNNKTIIIFAVSEMTIEMFDLMKGLKAREEMLNELRFFFRNEDRLKREGWYSDDGFFEAVLSIFLEGLKKMLGG